MGGFGDDGYEARTKDELDDDLEDSVDSEYGDDLEPYKGSFARALIAGFAGAVAENQEQDLESLYNSLFVESATGDELTNLAEGYGVTRQPAVAATGVVTWTRTDVSSDVTVPSGTPVSTQLPDPVEYFTTESVTLLGPETPSDSTTYTTQSDTFVVKTSFTIDVTYRDSIDVEASYRTTNSSYTAFIEINDATNSTTIASDSTTSTSAVSVGPTTYDTSSLDGDITVEYAIRIGNTSGTAELQSASVDVPGQYAADANIKADEAGETGNVGANRVTRMPSPPAGITEVTNNNPVGDPDYDLTNGDQQTLGQNQEDDESLRSRVLEGSSLGGAATVRAVRDKIRALDGTPSLTIYTNRTTTDNNFGNGLPELSAELVIHATGVTDQDIAEAIHDIIAVTTRLASGNVGTAKSYTITSEVLDDDRVIEWSEPNITNLEVTVDVVDEAGYVGDEKVKEVIAEYIGGTLPDGSPVAGLDVSDDVIVDELERRINNLDGIVGVATVTLDADGDGNDDTTTRSDGLTAYEVANNELAQVDASGNDVTVN